jgi:hypothetical protein
VEVRVLFGACEKPLLTRGFLRVAVLAAAPRHRLKAFRQRTAPPCHHGQRPDLSQPRAVSAWLITLAATAASTYALDAVATAAGVLLVVSQLTRADGTEMHTFRADAHRDLADVAWRTGDHEVAMNAAAFALRLYDVKESVAAAAQLRAQVAGRPLHADD